MSMILIYNVTGEREAKLKLLCRKMNLGYMTVEKADYGRTLGSLLGSGDDTVREGADFDDEMLYIAGLRGGMLNLFLDQLKRRKILIPLKAIRTETNMGFTSCELYRELCAEREAIAKGMTAHQS